MIMNDHPSAPTTTHRPGPERVDPFDSPPVADHASITDLRARVDAIDDRIVRLLADRCALATSLAHAKADQGLEPLDPAREAAVVRRAEEAALARGIGPASVRDIYGLVIGLCRATQRGEAL